MISFAQGNSILIIVVMGPPFIQSVQYTGHHAECVIYMHHLHALSHLILIITLWSKCFSDPSYTSEEKDFPQGISLQVLALSVDQCRLQVSQFSVHLINLLSVLLRCNGFAGIQKAVVDQTGSRPPSSDHDLFLVQVWLGEVLWSFFSVQPLS